MIYFVNKQLRRMRLKRPLKPPL